MMWGFMWVRCVRWCDGCWGANATAAVNRGVSFSVRVFSRVIILCIYCWLWIILMGWFWICLVNCMCICWCGVGWRCVRKLVRASTRWRCDARRSACLFSLSVCVVWLGMMKWSMVVIRDLKCFYNCLILSMRCWWVWLGWVWRLLLSCIWIIALVRRLSGERKSGCWIGLWMKLWSVILWCYS